jgi:glutamate 5-kinase
MKQDRKFIFSKAKRVIVKVGSNVLTEDHGLNLSAIRSIARQICKMALCMLTMILASALP